MSEIRQTILVISNDALLCAAVRRDLETRRPEVRVSAVSGIAAALRIVEDAAPSAILLAADSPDELQDNVQDNVQEGNRGVSYRRWARRSTRSRNTRRSW